MSNAVNSPHLVRSETLARVVAAADRLEYRPNAAARAMRTGQVGVLAARFGPGLERSHPAVADAGFPAALAAAAQARGRSLVAFTATDDDAEARHYAELVAGLGLDGVLVGHGDRRGTTTDPRLVWLTARRVRGVLIGPGDGREPGLHARVDVDVAAGFRAVTARLVELGHRRIAVVGPGADLAPEGRDDAPASSATASPGPEHRGWSAAMAAAGLPTDGLAVATGSDLEGVRSAVSRILARHIRPTALLCTTELVAAVGHAEITAWGLTVGEDVVVVGVGDGLALRALDVATLAVPTAALAEVCVELLLRPTPTAGDFDTPPVAPVVHLVPDLHPRRSLVGPSGPDTS